MKSQLSIIAALSLGLSIPAAAQTSPPIVGHGACDAESGVTVNDRETSQYSCNGVFIVRTQRGTVLVQFADSTGDDGRMLGFGGVIEGKQGFGADTTQMMAVQRIYLGRGDPPIQAEKGTCILNWTGLQRTGGKLTSVVCGGLGSVDGSTVKALVAFGVR